MQGGSIFQMLSQHECLVTLRWWAWKKSGIFLHSEMKQLIQLSIIISDTWLHLYFTMQCCDLSLRHANILHTEVNTRNSWPCFTGNKHRKGNVVSHTIKSNWEDKPFPCRAEFISRVVSCGEIYVPINVKWVRSCKNLLLSIQFPKWPLQQQTFINVYTLLSHQDFGKVKCNSKAQMCLDDDIILTSDMLCFCGPALQCCPSLMCIPYGLPMVVSNHFTYRVLLSRDKWPARELV